MKYIIESKKELYTNYTLWHNLSKGLFFVFFIYVNFYKEIWGDKPLLLYGSVVLLTISVVISFTRANCALLDFRNLPDLIKSFFFFGIYCFIIGIIVCINQSSFISSMITYFCFFVVLFDCCIISQQANSWEWLLKILLIVSLFCAFYTILRGQPLNNGGATVITMGPHNNPNTLALVLLIGLFGLFAMNKEEGKKTLFNLFIVLVLLYSIVLTGSRKCLIASCVLFFIWIISILKAMRARKRSSSTAIVIVGLLLSAIVIGWFFANQYKDSDQFSRLLRLFEGDEDSANEDRIKMYQLAFSIWQEHPIFGVGFNQFKHYSWRGDYSHSVYAEVLSCTGLLGTLILFIPVIKNTINVLKTLFKTNGDNRYIYSICLAGVLTEFILGLGQIWVYGINHMLYLLCITGLFENYRNKTDSYMVKKGEIEKCQYIKH